MRDGLIKELRELNTPLSNEAADAIEDWMEIANEWVRVFDMLNDRENRHHYLEYWRKENGASDLAYPDGDQIYKDFWELKNELDSLKKARE